MTRNDYIDIRNVFPVYEQEIKIFGEDGMPIPKQLNILIEKNYIKEIGSDGNCPYIILQNLFTPEEIDNKIKELGGEE